MGAHSSNNEITDFELARRYRDKIRSKGGYQSQLYNHDTDTDGKKKRVGKACDSCRMKKTKCDGKRPCTKCSQDNKLCTYSEKKKLQERTYSSSYVELLECRIHILQDSIYKIISKTKNDESIKNYVPKDDDFSINHIIDLVMRDEEADDAGVPIKQEDDEDEDDEEPLSAIGSEESPASIDDSYQTSSNPLYLDLGPYKSGAAMAAAAASGNPITLPNSPTSTIDLASSPGSDTSGPDWNYFTNTNSSFQSDNDTISPKLLNSDQKSASFTTLSSSSNAAQPHKLGRRGSAGHLSKLHKAGSHFHRHPSLSNNTDPSLSPYQKPQHHYYQHSENNNVTTNFEQYGPTPSYLHDNENNNIFPVDDNNNLGNLDEINVYMDDLWLGIQNSNAATNNEPQ